MKLFKGVLLFALAGAIWSTSAMIKSHRLNDLVANGKIPYGPIPREVSDYYSYNGLHSAFNSRVELRRADEFTKDEFENLILNSLDSKDRENFRQHLASTLNFSVDYQIDPFWIISVMMVESRFQLKATSNKNALGLMQIQPDTAEHLYQLMRKKVSDEQVGENLHQPDENIEVGIFYLKKLLQNFRLNYRLATIAYNVGPNKLKNRLEENDIDTVNFSYLLKVQESYQVLTKVFIHELKKHPRPYELTYVVLRGESHLLEDRLLGFYVASQPALNDQLLLTSENLSTHPPQSLAF